MQLEKLEKIQILLKLVKKYYTDDTDIRYVLKSTIDLAYIIEHFKSIPTSYIQSEESVRRSKFLYLVINMWSSILSDLNKSDVIIHEPYNNNYSNKRYINSNIHIIHCNSEYEEIHYIFNFIYKFKNEKLTVICPNQSVLKLLQLKLNFYNLNANFIIPYCKYYSNISQKFKDKVNKYFPNNYKICEELSFLDPSNVNHNSNITITDLRNLTSLKNSNKIFILDMNQTSFQFPILGKYWLSHPIIVDPENAFYHILSYNKEVYLLYTSSLLGKSVFKSNVLSKFEIQSCHNTARITNETAIQNIENSNDIDNNNNDKIINNNINGNNTKESRNYYELPTTLYASELTDLIYTPDKFYVQSILKVKPELGKSEIAEVFKDFKEIFYQYFNKLNQADYYLERIKSINALYFEKCQQIVTWLQSYNSSFSSINNKALAINYLNKIIKAHFDRVELDRNQLKIIKYQLTSNINIKNILIGKDTTLLAQCCILYNMLTTGQINELNFGPVGAKANKVVSQILNPREYQYILEIWYPNWKPGCPIIRKGIPVPQSAINNFFELLNNVLR